MLVRFAAAPRMRCDFIMYSGISLSGRKRAVRIFPTGGLKGVIDSENLRSMVIRAPHGTRVILATHPGDDWDEHSWRCIRLVKGHTVPSEKRGGLPGVRIPDLDNFDRPSAKRVDTEFQASFPLVDSFEEGEGWTFGRNVGGELKGRVQMILVDRDDTPLPEMLTDMEVLVRKMLERTMLIAPDAVRELSRIALAALPEREQVAALEAWLEERS